MSLGSISVYVVLTADCSIFGRATAGLDVIHAIEEAKVDKNDKPWEDIKMVSIDVM